MNIVNFIYYFIFFYYFILMFIGLFNFRSPFLPLHNKGSMLAIIPAHNEASNIANTIKGLFNSGITDIVVVCDTCSDKTSDISKSLGCYIFNTYQKNKGKALNDFFLRSDLYGDYDFYTIIDCGSVVKKEFVQVCKDNLVLYPVVQVYMKTSVYKNTLVSGYYRVVCGIQELMCRGRDILNINGYLSGSCFAWSNLYNKYIHFNSNCLIEDMELSFSLHKQKIKIKFLFGIIAYDEKPYSFKTSFKQLLRWARGYWWLFFHGYFYTYRIDDFISIVSIFFTFLFFPMLLISLITTPYFYIIFCMLYVIWCIGDYIISGNFREFSFISFIGFPIMSIISIFISFISLFSWNNRNWNRTEHKGSYAEFQGSGGADLKGSEASDRLVYYKGETQQTNIDEVYEVIDFYMRDGI